MEARTAFAGEDPEEGPPSTGRHRRARTLIAISMVAASIASLAYLYPSWLPAPKAIQPNAAHEQASSVQTDPPLVETFMSPRMYFSLRYPAGWSITPATEAWREKGASWTPTQVDLLKGEFVALRATSQELDRGQAADAWLRRYLAAAASTCLETPNEAVAIDGHLGVIDSNGCPASPLAGQLFDVAVVAGGRGYNFTMEGAVDRASFLAILKTVRFGAAPPPEPMRRPV